MSVHTIDANMLKSMFLAGARRLDSRKEWINELNVFPVPDGDTGTNMTMTITSAANAVSALEAPTMASLSKAISQGALRGARGNSGVILSQLFRGFTKVIKEVDEIDHVIASEAFARATETAYKAVMKPKEGTILTVARGMSEKAADVLEQTDDLEEAFRQIIEYGNYMLSLTPEMLPVLKQAGVVDSGGQGLMVVLEGAYDCMTGKDTGADEASASAGEEKAEADTKAGLDEIETADIRFGYCTEFIIMLEKPFDEQEEASFKAFLSSIGDSIVCVADTDIVKVHVHTNDPGLAIQKGLSYGQLTSMKIDNMREEHNERLIKDAQKIAQQQAREEKAPAQPAKDVGFVAVSMGEGMKQIFTDLGVDYVVEGGQTMNPSTADILDAVDHVNAKTVFVLPDNKNIILAAQQAAELAEDKRVIVIPSRNVPQGIAALINYIEGNSDDDNAAAMTEEMSNIRSAQITYAVRDTTIDEKDIRQGNIMGLGDNGLLAVGEDIDETTIATVAAMIDEDCEIISIYYGSDVSEEDAQALSDRLAEIYPNCEVELNNGGQPIYYYVLSVE